jgi:molybdenum cofactor cytidylyltransferase
VNGVPGSSDSRAEQVGAVVLAAGTSSRMGEPKQLMHWGTKPMVRHVVDVLAQGGAQGRGIMVVVGAQRAAVETALVGTQAVPVFNPQFADGSMLRSLQVGLRAAQSVEPRLEAALVALGDQPQLRPEVVRAVIARWCAGQALIVAPSFSGRRGHPILFDRAAWARVLEAPPAGSPREVLGEFSDRSEFVDAQDDSVLRDIDTPEDYRRELERRV